jgi:hypothetical protein
MISVEGGRNITAVIVVVAENLQFGPQIHLATLGMHSNLHKTLFLAHQNRPHLDLFSKQ